MTQLALDGHWKTRPLSYHHKCMCSLLPLSLAASCRPVGCPAGGSSSSRPSWPADGCSSLWPYWAVDGCSAASLSSTASAPFIVLSRLRFRSRLPLSQAPTALPTRLRSTPAQRQSVFMKKKTNTRRFIEKMHIFPMQILLYGRIGRGRIPAPHGHASNRSYTSKS